MTATTSGIDLPHFQRVLQAREAQLHAAIRDALLRGDDEQYAQIAGQVHDLEDEALADLLVDVNLADITRDIQELRDVAAALRRIGLGTYGICSGCKAAIARARLEAYPTAKRCITCQQEEEARRRSLAPTHSL